MLTMQVFKFWWFHYEKLLFLLCASGIELYQAGLGPYLYLIRDSGADVIFAKHNHNYG